MARNRAILRKCREKLANFLSWKFAKLHFKKSCSFQLLSCCVVCWGGFGQVACFANCCSCCGCVLAAQWSVLPVSGSGRGRTGGVPPAPATPTPSPSPTGTIPRVAGSFLNRLPILTKKSPPSPPPQLGHPHQLPHLQVPYIEDSF
jgi:hypothetical protein